MLKKEKFNILYQAKTINPDNAIGTNQFLIFFCNCRSMKSASEHVSVVSAIIMPTHIAYHV